MKIKMIKNSSKKEFSTKINEHFKLQIFLDLYLKFSYFWIFIEFLIFFLD